jgi:TM2 domain-containing membrane protein YozV
MKSKVVAALLAFFLGGIGIHRFYLGQMGLGIMYLLFCWTFIPSVIAFLDGIIFLAVDSSTFDAKYNTGI